MLGDELKNAELPDNVLNYVNDFYQQEESTVVSRQLI